MVQGNPSLRKHLKTAQRQCQYYDAANLQNGLKQDKKNNGRSKDKQHMDFKTVSRIIILCRENQVKAKFSQDLDHQTLLVATYIQVDKGSWNSVRESSTGAWGSSPGPLWWAWEFPESLALSTVPSMKKHPSSTQALQAAASCRPYLHHWM